VPIPKECKKSINDWSNYKGIAPISILAKVFDIVLIEKCGDGLKTCDLQYSAVQNSFKRISDTCK
jgi:hypothetical protein